MSPANPDSLFDAERLRVYPRMTVAIYILAAIAVVATSTAMIDIFGKPLGYDFITFWAASHLTLAGEAAAAFDVQRIFAAEQLAVPAGDSIFLWNYPPTYQLVVAPLALLPYVAAYLVFVGASLAAYVLTLRRLFDERVANSRDAFFLLVAFPGAFVCVFHGQNSLYSVALFAGGLLAMERGRPYLAGFALGLLAYKPQLGLLIPIALIASRQWRVFFATGATAFGFAALATLVLGPDLWLAFLKNTPLVREVMEQGLLRWYKMPSAFIFFRYLGVPTSIAYALQVLTALGAAACVALVWWRAGPSRLAWAVLVAATLLVPPYTFDYELAILALVLVILAGDMVARGATTFEKAALVFLYVMPVLVAPISQATHLQIGFPALLLALALSVKRALAQADRLASLSSPAPL
ncbi:MAG: glycosyltransferase family 87 protein [Parvibaculum sp.]|uniref:glycosyltransferase family 87 protein n=1 Tax=Parvibaculum sp. TaxID=2024848 RepID=UPI003C71E3A6